jgi:hypothetical protein
MASTNALMEVSVLLPVQVYVWTMRVREQAASDPVPPALEPAFQTAVVQRLGPVDYPT